MHEYTGTFAGQAVRFKMTSVCGHVMTLDFLGEPPVPLPTLHSAEGSPARCCPGSSWREACPEPMSHGTSRLWRVDSGSLGEVPRMQALVSVPMGAHPSSTP